MVYNGPIKAYKWVAIMIETVSMALFTSVSSDVWLPLVTQIDSINSYNSLPSAPSSGLLEHGNIS